MKGDLENAMTYQDQRTWVVVAYVLHFFGILAFPSVIGLILNYLKRDDSLPDLGSHHAWMIRTFWWGLFWLIVSALTAPIYIGFVISFFLLIWWYYRHIRGLIRLADRLAMPT